MVTEKAVIFDLDGTLVDTQTEFHSHSEAVVLKRRGIKVDREEITKLFAGRSTREMFRHYAPSHDPNVLWHEKWDMMRTIAQTTRIEPMPFADELVRTLHARNVPIAVASASPMSWIKACMESARLSPWFTHYTSGHEVAQNKPAPDVFLLAAERLGVCPADCAAVEDSMAGVQSAVAAGMQTYWLTESREIFRGVRKISSLLWLI